MPRHVSDKHGYPLTWPLKACCYTCIPHLRYHAQPHCARGAAGHVTQRASCTREPSCAAHARLARGYAPATPQLVTTQAALPATACVGQPQAAHAYASAAGTAGQADGWQADGGPCRSGTSGDSGSTASAPCRAAPVSARLAGLACIKPHSPHEQYGKRNQGLAGRGAGKVCVLSNPGSAQ